MPDVLELGVGGIFALLVIRTVLIDFLGRGQRRPEWVDEIHNQLELIDKRLAELQVESKDLHRWHSPNSEGEQTWKGTHMGRVLGGIADALNANTKAIQSMCIIAKEMKKKSK